MSARQGATYLRTLPTALCGYVVLHKCCRATPGFADETITWSNRYERGKVVGIAAHKATALPQLFILLVKYRLSEFLKWQNRWRRSEISLLTGYDPENCIINSRDASSDSPFLLSTTVNWVASRTQDGDGGDTVSSWYFLWILHKDV